MTVVGVYPIQPGESVFNRCNLGLLLYLIISIILETASFLFDNTTIQEYTETFFARITVLSIFIGYLLNIVKSEEIFQLIENMEKFVESRK